MEHSIELALTGFRRLNRFHRDRLGFSDSFSWEGAKGGPAQEILSSKISLLVQ